MRTRLVREDFLGPYAAVDGWIARPLDGQTLFPVGASVSGKHYGQTPVVMLEFDGARETWLTTTDSYIASRLKAALRSRRIDEATYRRLLSYVSLESLWRGTAHPELPMHWRGCAAHYALFVEPGWFDDRGYPDLNRAWAAAVQTTVYGGVPVIHPGGELPHHA